MCFQQKIKRNYTIEELEQLLDSIPYEVYIKDVDGKYRYANKASADRVGLKKEDIIGKKDYDFRSKEMAKICVDGDRMVLRRGKGTFIEDKLVKGDIETAYELFKSIIYDSKTNEKLIAGIAKFVEIDNSVSKYIIRNSGTIMNNTMDLNTNTVNNEILTNLKETTDAEDVALYLYDKSERVMNLNKHLGKNNMLFRNTYKIEDEIKNEYYNNIECTINEILSDNSIKYIYLLKNNNKLLGCIHIYYKNKPKEIKEEFIKYNCLVLSFMQNTKILTDNLNKELKKRMEAQKKKEQLEQIVEVESLKTEFFANLSHEFKTPLNMILSTVQVILNYMEVNGEYPEYKTFKRYVNNIKQNSYRLLKLSNNMIDLTKIDGGFYELNIDNYNIVEVVENIVQSVAVYIKDKKRNIVFDTEEEEIITACDPDKIERIILNILSNAIKYTYDNGNIYVNIEVNCTCNKLIIRMGNDGDPLSVYDFDKVFKRFTQAENLLTRSREGSGIGLALVKSLVEMHKGIIYINPNVNKGTEFCIELPIRKIMNVKSSYPWGKSMNSKVEKFDIEFSDIYN
ncbi:MAG: ATP-binding protein [Clostridium sp.]